MILVPLLLDLGAQASSPPLILANPQNQSVLQGQQATFVIVASGQFLSYQWYRNGVLVAGATATSYTTNPTSVAADNGALFTCTVTNSAGSVTSTAALLTVVVTANVLAFAGLATLPTGPVVICNLALQMLGAAAIVALSDNNNNARAMRLAYQPVLFAELRRHRWKFSILRVNLPVSSTTPVNGFYTLAYNIPADNLRILNIGDWDPGQDVSDYRYRSTSEYQIENGMILTNYAPPLSLRYVTNSVAPGDFDSAFTMAFAARLAWQCCETITQSETKRQLAMKEYSLAIREAIAANALESAPEFRDDDSWVVARIA